MRAHTRTAVTFTLTLAAAVLLSPEAAAAKPPKPVPLVQLDIEAPRYRPDEPTGIMFSSGWPLVFKLVISEDALGIATNEWPSDFPTRHETGYVVFSDPDGCLALPPPFAGSCIAASDETYLEFTNDVDEVGVADFTGNPGRGAALADPGSSGGPSFWGASTGAGPPVVTLVGPVGPLTGDSIDDGFGYGADDDLPGLVLLAPYGVGLGLDVDFNRPAVQTQRNLAGFLNWVSYELRASTGSTVIHSGMVVPYGLVAPLMKTDDCVGETPESPCDSPAWYQVDGGSLVTAGSTGFQNYYPDAFEAQPYELRAFVVSGVAPSVLTDLNSDGTVSSADATLAGYTVLSNEKVIQLRQYHGKYCGITQAFQVFFADFDGNDQVIGPVGCPAGPGQIQQPPR